MSKYGNRKVEVDGITFDSVAEARRYGELCLLVLAGEIQELRCHPRYMLLEPFTDAAGQKVRAVHYTPDFDYLDARTGRRVAEDVKGRKGTITEAFTLRSKFFRHRYPGIELRVVG